MQSLADLVVDLGGMPHERVGVDDVPVTSTDPLAIYVARFNKIVDDPLRGPLGDANRGRDIPKTDIRVTLDRE